MKVSEGKRVMVIQFTEDMYLAIANKAAQRGLKMSVLIRQELAPKFGFGDEAIYFEDRQKPKTRRRD